MMSDGNKQSAAKPDKRTLYDKVNIHPTFLDPSHADNTHTPGLGPPPRQADRRRWHLSALH